MKYINCSGKKGDVIIFNSNTCHSGTRNLHSRRDCIIFKFLPLLGKTIDIYNIHPNIENKLTEYEKYVFGIKKYESKN